MDKCTNKSDRIFLNENPPLKQSLVVFGYCLLLSVLFLLIGTKSSPLYPFNDWVDANTSFTMGKAMMNGRVLYRDIFDHKGPLFYFLFGLGYLISNTSFGGVFFLEVISFSLLLYYCFKSILLFLEPNYALIALPLITASVINLKSFTHGGSAEEFCLPLIAISLYYLLNYFKNIYPKPIPRSRVFINGIIAGCVLWIKFSLLGFWFGWMVTILVSILSKKDFLSAIRTSLLFVLGMITATLPWVVYFGFNQSISEWINSYFIINITSYSTPTSLFSKFIFVLIVFFAHLLTNPLIVGHLLLGVIVFLTNKKFNINRLSNISILASILFLIISLYGGGRGYIYYFLSFSPFLIFGFIVFLTLVFEKIGSIKSKKSLHSIITVLVTVTFLFTLGLNHNTYMLTVNQEDLVQYQYAKIINQTEGATLLNYGSLDGGFYTTTGIVPNVRFFQNSNIDYQKFPLAMDEQNRYIKEKVVDYIIINLPPGDSVRDIEAPYLNENYTLIEKEIQQNEVNYFYYLLFKKID